MKKSRAQNPKRIFPTGVADEKYAQEERDMESGIRIGREMKNRLTNMMTRMIKMMYGRM
jgi:hypothetical protein